MKPILKYICLSAALFALFSIFSISEANAATLFFSPSAGNHKVGNILSTDVLVNTQGQVINSSDAVINFPTGLLEVVSVSKSGSIFSLWVEEPAFSNGAGTISFVGGLPTPGFNGLAGKIVNIVFRIKNVGTASLVFSSAAVRANDGFGTDVLSNTNQASFNFGPASVATPTPQVSPPRVSVPQITSPTHPDSNKWYSNNDPVFEIGTPPVATDLKLGLSRNPGGQPQVDYSPPISQRKLDDLDDGVWYLHAQFRTAAGWSAISSFKFQIDTENPASFELTRLDPDGTSVARPKVVFESSDGVSGLDRYEIKIGDDDSYSIDPDDAGIFELPVQRPGTRTVTVKALDKAGNYASASLTINVNAIAAPKIDPLPEVIDSEKPFVIKGKALPGSEVNILILSASEVRGIINANPSLVKTVTVNADENGDWSAEINGLASGSYLIKAYSQDKDGAISEETEPVAIKVESVFWKEESKKIVKVVDLAVGFISENIALLLGILAIIAFIIWLIRGIIWFHVHKLAKFIHVYRQYKLSSSFDKQHKKTSIEIKMLTDDIKKELALLKKIENHRGLNMEEKYLKDKLTKYLSLLK